MKKQKLIKEIRKIGKRKGVQVFLVREGGNHEIWQCGEYRFPVPRHGEVKEPLAKGILRNVEEEG